MRITSFAITVTNKIAVSITSIKFLFTTKLERSVFLYQYKVRQGREKEGGKEIKRREEKDEQNLHCKEVFIYHNN